MASQRMHNGPQLICLRLWWKLEDEVQVLRSWNELLHNREHKVEFRCGLFCRPPDCFREQLRALVGTMAPHGFTSAAVGVLASRRAQVVLSDPDWLAVQFEMLRAFFAPYGDAPATVARMTKGLQASLPAVVPDAKQPQRQSSGPRHQQTSRACTEPRWPGPHRA